MIHLLLWSQTLVQAAKAWRSSICVSPMCCWWIWDYLTSVAIVVTVFGDEEHMLASIEAGAAGYLLKDATEESSTAGIR